jgi:hypothetical protein
MILWDSLSIFFWHRYYSSYESEKHFQVLGQKALSASLDRWFLATALASRLAIVKEFLEEKHRMEEIYKMEENGAVAIQRSWRLYKESKREKIVNVAFGVIANMIKRVFSRLLLRRVFAYAERRESISQRIRLEL